MNFKLNLRKIFSNKGGDDKEQSAALIGDEKEQFEEIGDDNEQFEEIGDETEQPEEIGASINVRVSGQKGVGKSTLTQPKSGKAKYCPTDECGPTSSTFEAMKRTEEKVMFNIKHCGFWPIGSHYIAMSSRSMAAYSPSAPPKHEIDGNEQDSTISTCDPSAPITYTLQWFQISENKLFLLFYNLFLSSFLIETVYVDEISFVYFIVDFVYNSLRSLRAMKHEKFAISH